MPVHDWSRVEAGTFHAFHGCWITHLMGALNNGILPEGIMLSQSSMPGCGSTM